MNTEEKRARAHVRRLMQSKAYQQAADKEAYVRNLFASQGASPEMAERVIAIIRAEAA